MLNTENKLCIIVYNTVYNIMCLVKQKLASIHITAGHTYISSLQNSCSYILSNNLGS